MPVTGDAAQGAGSAAPGPGEQPAERAVRQAAALLAGDETTRGLGIAVGDVEPGRASATMTVTPGMLNGHGTCHGGYVFLLADTAFAFACNTHGPAVVAAGADVDFLAPAHSGDRLVARAAERVLAGRSGIYDVTVTGPAGRVVAEFRGRSRQAPGGPRAG